MNTRLNKQFPWVTATLNAFDESGWRPLIANFLADIEHRYRAQGIEPTPGTASIISIDERWGALRIQADLVIDSEDLIEALEVASESVCHRCGAEGSIQGCAGLIEALCDDCATRGKD